MLADPNDIQFTHTGAVDTTSGHSSTTFATITIPAGAEATLHCFVPIGCQKDHAHGPNEYPNMIDPQGGWTESSESYMENNGIERKRLRLVPDAADKGWAPIVGEIVEVNEDDCWWEAFVESAPAKSKVSLKFRVSDEVKSVALGKKVRPCSWLTLEK